MAKELPFFKFEPASWKFGRIQRQPDAIKICFIDFCCKFWYDGCSMTLEDAKLDFGTDEIETLIKNKIIHTDGENVWVNFLIDQLEKITGKSLQASLAGKASAAAREAKKIELNDGSTDVERNPTDKIRGEEIRGEESLKAEQARPTYANFLKFFNEKMQRKFRGCDKSKRQFAARAKQGYTAHDFAKAIEALKNDLYHISSSFIYATPELITRPDKLEKFINQVNANPNRYDVGEVDYDAKWNSKTE